MKKKIMVLICVLALVLGLTGCGTGEETTLTGIIVSVDGTVISLLEMDTNLEDRNFSEGERPSMPSDMEGSREFGNFPGEGFEGTLPEGETFPQWHGSGERPENGEMQELPFGGNGGMRPGFGNFGSDAETQDIDIGNAHISVEIEEGKASGSMEDITPGTFVTVTLNSKGEAVNVLVSSMFGFGGRRPSRGS